MAPRSHRIRLLAAGLLATVLTVLGGGAHADLDPYQAGESALVGDIVYAPGQGVNVLASCAAQSWTMSLTAAGVEVQLAANEYAGPATLTVEMSDWCAHSGSLSFPFGSVSVQGTGPLGTLSCSQFGGGEVVGTVFVLHSAGGCTVNGVTQGVALLLQATMTPNAVQGVQVTQGLIAGSMEMRGELCPLDCVCIPEDCPPPPPPPLVPWIIVPPNLRTQS